MTGVAEAALLTARQAGLPTPISFVVEHKPRVALALDDEDPFMGDEQHVDFERLAAAIGHVHVVQDLIAAAEQLDQLELAFGQFSIVAITHSASKT